MLLTEALTQAQQLAPELNWSIEPSNTGGWFLQASQGGLITYMTNPCAMNLGEEGKPFMTNCNGLLNYDSLEKAVNHIKTRNR
jgi:hypothetical protein